VSTTLFDLDFYSLKILDDLKAVKFLIDFVAFIAIGCCQKQLKTCYAFWLSFQRDNVGFLDTQKSNIDNIERNTG
jgi:hypothetical protein